MLTKTKDFQLLKGSCQTVIQLQYNAHLEILNRAVRDRCIIDALKVVPSDAIGFRFIDIFKNFDSRENNTTQMNYSGWIYPGGVIIDSHMVKKNISNIYSEISDKVVFTRRGMLLPFYPKDKVVSDPKNHIGIYNGLFRWQ